MEDNLAPRSGIVSVSPPVSIRLVPPEKAAYPWRSRENGLFRSAPLSVHRRGGSPILHAHFSRLRRARFRFSYIHRNSCRFFREPFHGLDQSASTPGRLRNPSPSDRPHHSISRFGLNAIQLRLRSRHAVPSFQRELREWTIPQSEELLHGGVLRSLSPGGISPVAPDGPRQQLSCPVVFEERQRVD